MGKKGWIKGVGIMLILAVLFGGVAGCKSKNTKKETTKKEDDGSASLSFQKMRDGGNTFEIIIEDETLVDYDSESKGKNSKNGEKGGSYKVTYTFYGKNPGTTRMTIEEYLHGDLYDTDYYIIEVDDDLNVTIEYDDDRMNLEYMPVLTIGEREITLRLADNASAAEFYSQSGNTIHRDLGKMTDLNGNEKAFTLLDIPYDKSEVKTTEVKPGDVIRYHVDTKLEYTSDDEVKEKDYWFCDFAIVYAPHTVDCVVVGHLEDITEDELSELLSSDEELEVSMLLKPAP